MLRNRRKKNERALGFSVFVSSLCLSDLLMGLYLTIIGTADQVFQGIFLWNELAWKQHTMCQVINCILYHLIKKIKDKKQ